METSAAALSIPSQGLRGPMAHPIAGFVVLNLAEHALRRLCALECLATHLFPGQSLTVLIHDYFFPQGLVQSARTARVKGGHAFRSTRFGQVKAAECENPPPPSAFLCIW